MNNEDVYLLFCLIKPYIIDIRSLVIIHSFRSLALGNFEYPSHEFITKRNTFKKLKNVKNNSNRNYFRMNSWNRKKIINRDDIPIMIS